MSREIVEAERVTVGIQEVPEVGRQEWFCEELWLAIGRI
jgi:hypothetical protein